MSILSVVLANPTLLVVVIGVSFGAVVWFVFIRSDGGKKEQSPKAYKPASPEKEDHKKEKPATPDRRTLHLRTAARRSPASSSRVGCSSRRR